MTEVGILNLKNNQHTGTSRYFVAGLWCLPNSNWYIWSTGIKRVVTYGLEECALIVGVSVDTVVDK